MRALSFLCCALLAACGKPINLTPPVYAPLPPTAEAAEEVPGARLPADTQPLRYRLALELHPDRDTYTGHVAIDVALDRPRSTLFLHQVGMRPSEVKVVRPDGSSVLGKLEQRSASGLSALSLEESVGPGAARIEIAFEADIGRRLSGLYRADAGGIPYLFTQFEAISAREAFPCFDEPRFKTPFEITLRVNPELTAIANTQEASSQLTAEGLREVRFQPTEKLPTYLIALAVGPFDVVQAPALAPNAVRAHEVPLRGIAVKGRGAELAYALDETKLLLERLEQYFGTPYPYDKLDLIAVPDFNAGAMENAGAITFRDSILLVSEDATESQRRQLAYVNAHELAHQWFGNLVTMPWWDDIWLNEAFATWMGSRVVSETYPGYHAQLSELASTQNAMDVDSQAAARQIRQPVDADSDIFGAFDSITYSKGGAVLGMFEHFLGAAAFRAGLRLYMERHRFGSATAEDLIRALSEASAKPELTSAFNSFLAQPGVPALSASLSCEGPTPQVELRQARYRPLGSAIDAQAQWEIPVCIRYGTADGKSRERCTLVKEQVTQVALEGDACPTWWMPNAGAKGYYRWVLSEADFHQLLRHVGELSVAERISLASNLAAAMEAGTLPAHTALAALKGLSKEPARQVLQQVLAAYGSVEHDALDEAALPAYRAHLAAIVAPWFRELGLFAGPGETDPEIALKRLSVVRALGLSARDPNLSRELAKFGRAELGLGEPQKARLAPELRDAALTAALRLDPSTTLEPALARLRTSEDSQERARLLAAIVAVDDPAYSAQILALALSPTLRTNERLSPVYGQAANRTTRSLALAWLDQHYDALFAQLNINARPRLMGVLRYTCDQTDAEPLIESFRKRAEAVAGGRRAFALALESAELCRAFRAAQGKAVQAYFAGKVAETNL